MRPVTAMALRRLFMFRPADWVVPLGVAVEKAFVRRGLLYREDAGRPTSAASLPR